MNFLRSLTVVIALTLAGTMILKPEPAQALNRDVRAMLIVSSYGMIGGTVLGLAALPFNHDVRTVFIGTSLGLYLGIAVGIYYVYDRYDQNNPLRFRPQDRRQDGSVDRELRTLAQARVPGRFEAGPSAGQPLRLNVPVLHF